MVTTKLALGKEIEVLQKQRRVKQDRKNLKERAVWGSNDYNLNRYYEIRNIRRKKFKCNVCRIINK